MQTFLYLVLNMYLLIPNEKALFLTKKYSGKPVYEFSENNAVAYKLTNGQIIIFPSEGDSSLFFESIKEYKNFLKNPQFPNPENDLFYKYNQYFKNLENNIDFFKNSLSQSLGTPVTFINKENELVSLFNLVNNLKKIDREVVVPLGIVIGEYLRVRYMFAWDFNVVYTFKPYSIPILKNKHGIQFPLWKILDDFREDCYMDINIFLMRINNFLELSEMNFDGE